MRGYSGFLQAGFVAALLAVGPPCRAADRIVSNTSELAAALAAAQPGDNILLEPGQFSGGHFRHGLSQVTIRSQDPENLAEIVGGTNGIQLSDATSVTLENLVFRQQTGNGINIDDGGSFSSPSTNLTIRNVTVRDMNATGNNDGIKLSGVTGFLIDGVTVKNWGTGGSAIDPVGSHRGLIQNSWFQSTVATGGSAIRPKGGSKDITIRANYVEMPAGAGRGIQAGGSTGSQFFRFIDGDSGYEAAGITVEGNRILGGSSAISWVNIDGGVFHHNYIHRPGDWAFRMLNENVGQPIVPTKNGVMQDNLVVFKGDSWRRAGNFDGPGVMEETFTFARNQWFNEDDPTAPGSTPQLPSTETNGIYGQTPESGVTQTISYDFSWGKWVLPYPTEQTVNIPDHGEWLIATPGEGGVFKPRQSDPLSGNWTFSPAKSTVQTKGLEPVVLIRPDASSLIPSIPGDYDRSGAVDQDDYQLWRQQYGTQGPALADGNHDGQVDAIDYAVWRQSVGSASSETNPAATPTPGAVGLFFAGLLPFCLRIATRRVR